MNNFNQCEKCYEIENVYCVKKTENLKKHLVFAIIGMYKKISRCMGGVLMAKTTLQVIQSIEDEARKIKKIYDEKIEASRKEIEAKLAEDEVIFDHETEVRISELKEKQTEELNNAEEILTHSIETTNIKREQALKERKDELVRQIVQEVVNRYGD